MALSGASRQLPQREADDRSGSMGVVLFEHGSSAVGGGDLLHDMQAEDVGSILRGFRLVELGQHGGRVADAVAGAGRRSPAAGCAGRCC